MKLTDREVETLLANLQKYEFISRDEQEDNLLAKLEREHILGESLLPLSIEILSLTPARAIDYLRP